MRQLIPISLIFLFASQPSYAQKNNFGLVAYYFWEEDSVGNIMSAVEQPFEKNFVITPFGKKQPKATLSTSDIIQSIDQLSRKMRKEKKCTFRISEGAKNRKIHIKLRRFVADNALSVVYRKTPSGWECDTLRNVLHFQSDNTTRFIHQTDSIDGCPTQFIGSFWTTPDSSYYCPYFENFGSLSEKNLIYFNGYRRLRKHVHNNESDGLMATYDRYHYWFKLDDLFTERIAPDHTLYFDGSFGVSTSNHRNKLKFGWSYLRASVLKKKKSRTNYNGFNLKSNRKGFDERYEAGKLAGKVYLSALSQPKCEPPVRDTIDIVCHSMGYAYALGFLEIVEKDVVLNNCYIVAPENASYKGFDWNKFQHVWQYGTNQDQPNADPIYLQDGVAPQTAVKGIENLPKDKGGRLFTPLDWPTRNFVDSHMVYGYYWIFELLKPGMPGYVQ